MHILKIWALRICTLMLSRGECSDIEVCFETGVYASNSEGFDFREREDEREEQGLNPIYHPPPYPIISFVE